jgi:hypothetical protein
MPNAIGTVTRATAGKTEAELELYGYTEFAKLERPYGNALDSKPHQAGKWLMR